MYFSEDLTTGLSNFNGYNQPIIQWFAQFEEYLTSNQISTEQSKVIELMYFLNGTAVEWYADNIADHIKDPQYDWEFVKQKMFRRFGSSTDQLLIEAPKPSLNSCQQLSTGQQHNTCQPKTNPVVAKSQVSFVVNNHRKTEPFSNDTLTTDSTQQQSKDILIDLSKECSQQRNTGQQHNTCQLRTNSVVAKSQHSSVVNNHRETEPVLPLNNQLPKSTDENVFSSADTPTTDTTQQPSEDLLIDLSEDSTQPKLTATPFQTNEVLIPINISTAPQTPSLLDANIDEQLGHSKSQKSCQRSIETIQSDSNRKSNQPEEQPPILTTTSKSDYLSTLTKINSTQPQEQPTVPFKASKSKSHKPGQQDSHLTALVLKPKEKTSVKQRIPVQRPPLKRQFSFARIHCKSSLNQNKHFNDSPLIPINRKPLDVRNRTKINKWHRKYKSDSQRKRHHFSTTGKHSLRDINRKATVWFFTEPNLQRWGCEGGATRVSD